MILSGALGDHVFFFRLLPIGVATADHLLSHPLSLTFSSVNPLHYIHKSPLWFNFFSIAWQLHIQYPFLGSPPLHMSKASQSCILTTVLT